MDSLHGALPLALLLALPACSDSPAATSAPCLHSHNDYVHSRPLFDALDHRACGVEADVHLVDGELRVAHNLDQTEPGRTLASLYLDPLRQTIGDHDGSVYGDGAQLLLLIDIKSETRSTWEAIARTLDDYRELLTRFDDQGSHAGPLLVVISGNRPLAQLSQQPERLAGIDGRLAELEQPELAAISPLVSDNWGTNFFWQPVLGEMPAATADKLANAVKRAHDNGQRLRFWNVTETPEMWRVLADAGVDLLGVDDLAAGRAFLDAYR